MASFSVDKRSNGEFQFNLIANNGEIIFTSEFYGTRSSCLNGIESVKINSKNPDRFEQRTSKDGRPFFVLKAANGQIIGTSQMYKTADSCKAGIEAVMKGGPKAEMEEEEED